MKTKIRNKKAKTAAKIIVETIFFLSVTILIIALVIAIVARKKNTLPTVFGYSFSIVVSGSMEPEIKVGEMLLIKNADIYSVEPEDVVVFKSKSGASAGRIVAHKVIEKGYDENGVFLVTKGVNNALSDEEKVREADVIGKRAGQSVFLGKIITFCGRIENIVFLTVITVALAVSVRQIKIICGKGDGHNDTA